MSYSTAHFFVTCQYIYTYVYSMYVHVCMYGTNYRAHDNGRTSDILQTFTVISGQLVTWPEYMSVMPRIHVRYASMKNTATTKPGLLLIKFFCSSEVAMKPYRK